MICIMQMGLSLEIKPQADLNRPELRNLAFWMYDLHPKLRPSAAGVAVSSGSNGKKENNDDFKQAPAEQLLNLCSKF